MRLTLDIDGLDRGWWAWAVFYHLGHSGLCSRVELYQTRKGYHIIAYDLPLNERDIISLRRHYGDDMVRIELDMEKHPIQPRQVLWTRKNNHEVKLLATI